MTTQIYANFASALLAASIDDNDLVIQVASGFGALFPNPGATEFFLVTLENASGDREIVKIESRTSDLLTVASSGRAQEGTSAQSWTNGLTRVECRATKGTLDRFIQREGDAMSGDLDMGNNELQDALITTSVMEGGTLVGVAIRGELADGSNEILVPDDGSRATAGGAAILTEDDAEGVATAAFSVGMVMQWFGVAANCPDGWAICDGSTVNGHPTPNMTDKFVVGAGSTYTLNKSGGNLIVNSGSAGAHTHVSTSGAHALTEAEMPAHTHEEISYGLSVGAGTQASAIQTAGAPTGVPAATASTGGGGTHTHPDGTTDDPGDHEHIVETLPPYRALYFIMFVGF